MYENKNALLIAGGGTLGTYTASELLRLGANVDVICLEDKESSDERLTYYKSYATNEFLTELFSKKHYDGIVNFIHYTDLEAYKPVHKLLTENTDHLIFLSSYRVYADLKHPITEDAPRLLDVTDDKEFLEKEDYALAKARAENFIRNESNAKNYAIVRPVISFSDKRLDIVTVNNVNFITEKIKNNSPLMLPEITKNKVAGLDWAGNTGKLIANLLFKKETLTETYTVSSAQNLTWGEVADIYTKLTGIRFEWIDSDKWLRHPEYIQNSYWATIYDRFYDRTIDNSKILKATGLSKSDFLTIEEGLKTELAKLKLRIKI